MGLPTTLSGMLGFIIFLIFVIALIAPQLHNADASRLNKAQNDFLKNMNSSVNSTSTSENEGFWGLIGNATGLNGIYDFIVGFFQTAISFIILALAYFLAFIGISGIIPPVFYVFFAIFGAGAIVGIVKLIALRGD